MTWSADEWKGKRPAHGIITDAQAGPVWLMGGMKPDGLDAAEYNGRLARSIHDRPADWAYEPGCSMLTPGRVVPQRAVYMRGAEAPAAYPSLPSPLLVTVADGGVYDAEGRIEIRGAHLKDPMRNIPLPSPEGAQSDEHWKGRWVHGGYLAPHFGHFLTESLGRLWWFEESDAGPIDGIVFRWFNSVKFGETDRAGRLQPKAFVSVILDLLGISAPARTAVGPVCAETLIVPAQLMALTTGPQIAGHPRFRRFVARMAHHPSIDGRATARNLFVSRSRLEGMHGAIALEAWLDELFAAAGYDVVHPEALSLQDQISLYRSADRIVFTEGSALHLYAYVAQPGQRACIILRRQPAATYFVTQLVGAGVDAIGIDAVSAFVLPCLEEERAGGARGPIWNTRYSEAALDFVELQRQLTEAGFIPGVPVSAPGSDAVHAALEARLAEFSAVFAGRRFRVVPREAVLRHIQELQAGPPRPAARAPRRMVRPPPLS